MRRHNEETMAGDVYLVIDSDLHMDEPDDPWARASCADDNIGSSTGGQPLWL